MRRSNKNTLSGLSLDTIAQQVKGIIEQREKKTGSRGGGGSAAKGKTSSGRSRQPAEKKGKQVCVCVHTPVRMCVVFER